MTTATSESTDTGQQIRNGLRQVVADTYALMGQTHHCHWNVEGPSFFALHQAFEEQYTELFQAVDEIAERLRALGGYAPGGLDRLSTMAGFTEIAEEASASDMVSALLGQHGEAVKHIKEVRNIAGEADDRETEDLMIARLQAHEKTMWMLKSYLK
jgi:starvation-inducible DNA-binding protein